MYVEKVPNRNSPPAILLRESSRDGKRVIKRTIANISHWPEEQIEALRLVLKGKTMVPADEAFRRCGWAGEASAVGSEFPFKPAEGIEPTTTALQKRDSTVELRWHKAATPFTVASGRP